MVQNSYKFNSLQIVLFSFAVLFFLLFPAYLQAQAQFTDVSIFLNAVTDTTGVNEEGELENAVLPGANYTYTIDLENLTTLAADSFRITHLLPSHVVFVQSDRAPTLNMGNMLIWEVADLEGLATESWSVQVQVQDDIPETVNELVSNISFTCTDDSVSANNNATTVVLVLHQVLETVDVGIEINAQTDTTVERNGQWYDAAYDAEPLVYTLRVFNTSDITAKALEVTHLLPLDIRSEQQDPPYDSRNNDRYVWMIDSLQAHSDTSIIVQALPNIQTEALRLSSATVQVSDDSDSTNDADSISVLFLQRPKEPDYADLVLEYDVLSDTTIVQQGVEQRATMLGEPFAYFVRVTNTGPATARDIQIRKTVSPLQSFFNFSVVPTDSQQTQLSWEIDSLQTGDSWTLNVMSRASESIAELPHKLETHVSISAANDTLVENNSQTAIIYILNEAVPLPDLAVQQHIRADSFVVQDSDSIAVLSQVEIYQLSISLAHWTSVPAQYVRLRYIAHDSLRIFSASPSPDIYTADSVAWRLARVDPLRSLKFQVEVTVPHLMPVGENRLSGTVNVTAENEDTTALTNNTSTLSFLNYGQEAEPFEPLIEVSPVSATVSDSLFLRVQFPVQVYEWDVWIHLPDGSIIIEFADSFIASTLPIPGEWYEIPEPYVHSVLMGEASTEEIIFELRATGPFGSVGSARATARISLQTEFALLPPNVVSPEVEEIGRAHV